MFVNFFCNKQPKNKRKKVLKVIKGTLVEGIPYLLILIGLSHNSKINSKSM